MSLPQTCNNKSLKDISSTFAKYYINYCNKKDIKDYNDIDTIFDYVSNYTKYFSDIDEDIAILTYPLFAAEMLNNIPLLSNNKELSSDILSLTFYQHDLLGLMITYLVKDIISSYKNNPSVNIKDIPLSIFYTDDFNKVMNYENITYYENLKDVIDDKYKTLCFLLSDIDEYIPYCDEYSYSYNSKLNFIDYPIEFASFILNIKQKYES